MKDFIFILGFLCYFVINTVAGQQTWKEEGSNVMAGFSELYKEDIKLEKTQDNQNDKMNELEGLIIQLKEKVTEQDGTIEWPPSAAPIFFSRKRFCSSFFFHLVRDISLRTSFFAI